jgi:tRNA(Arg) A34 adenosine deaminase TadA
LTDPCTDCNLISLKLKKNSQQTVRWAVYDDAAANSLFRDGKQIMSADSYMDMALEEARAAARRGEVPVGAVLVDADSGEVLARAGNLTEELNDPTAHAEILVIRAAAGAKGEPRLPNCDLYVTLEPCPMCAAAISFARLRRVYFGAYDPKSGGIDHGPRVFESTSCHHRPEVYGGIGEVEAGKLLKEFFGSLR